MRKKQGYARGIIHSLLFLSMILNAKTVTYHAKAGVELCLYTVIPSLFPFILISLLLNNTLSGIRFRFMRPLAKVMSLPDGAENILLVGLLGGYPVGAQAVADGCRSGQLSRGQAHRLLGFCNNAGPAFLFGIGAHAFEGHILWVLWTILLLSTIPIAMILPKAVGPAKSISVPVIIGITEALQKALGIMSGICGWVVLFRIGIGFLQQFLIFEQSTVFCGLLELSNGCVQALAVSPVGLRFVLFALFCSFGGFCVLLQTKSVTKDLGLGQYFPGKLLQSSICTTGALLVQPLLFEGTEIYKAPPFVFLLSLLPAVIGILLIKKQ